MGQAALDLPDSLEPPPATAASTDDLLAQLASEEIDRLLAEADGDGSSSLKSSNGASPLKLVEPIDSLPISFEDREADAPLKAPSAVVHAPASDPGAELDPDVSTQINDLFVQFSQDSASPAAAPPAPLAPQADVARPPTLEPAIERRNSSRSPAVESRQTSGAVARAVPAAPLEDRQNDDQTSAAERGALDTSGAAVAAGEIDAALGVINRDAGHPFYLRPLELLSSPLNACSQDVRDIIGKIAILTAVNAVSILLYVLFFRRH